MAKDDKENRKKLLKGIALAAFLLSFGATGWFLVALLSDLMNPRLLSISFVSFVPPIALFLFMYLSRKYLEMKSGLIITEREEEREQQRQLLVAAGWARPASTKKPSNT